MIRLMFAVCIRANENTAVNITTRVDEFRHVALRSFVLIVTCCDDVPQRYYRLINTAECVKWMQIISRSERIPVTQLL